MRITLALYLVISAVVSAVYYASHYASGIDELFWYCNIALFISSAALFRKNSLWLTTILITAIPAQFSWIAGDIRYLLTGEILGRYQFLERETSVLGFLLNLNYHFTVIPVVFYGVLKYGFHRKAAWTAVLLLTVILFASRFLTDPASNINCAFFPCDMGQNYAVLETFGWRYTLSGFLIYVLSSLTIHFFLMKILPKHFIYEKA